MQFEVHAKYRCSRSGEGNENFVQTEGHHRADSGHNDGRQADGIDTHDNCAVRPEAFEIQGNLRILFCVQVDAERRADGLSQYCGPCRASYAHIEYKDKNGVKNDIDDRAQHLCNHGIDSIARSLQQPFVGDSQKDAEG